MKATIEQVSNGFLITTEAGQQFVASTLEGYVYSAANVVEVLKQIFEAKVTELKEAA